MNYKRINNICGWLVFAVAFLVYMLTLESTASWWDCGEFISSAFKLQVNHPPGAPLFLIIGRLFSLLSFGNKECIAFCMNSLSALSSALTILFLFWTITAIARKIVLAGSEISNSKIYAIIGSGLVGAMAFAFSDSFWYSAVEAEVYATSAFFTAVTFWAILRWENCDDEEYSGKWLVLVAFLFGLSIGVHLLNLLLIPAFVFIIYFKKYEVTVKGFISALVVATLSFALVQVGIVVQMLRLAAFFELTFVNRFGMFFNSGLLAFFILLVLLITAGIIISIKKGKRILNTAVLCFAFLLIGYSSYLIVPIRSNANPSLNENKPDNIFSFISYLTREQYGQTYLVYGPYYDAKYIGSEKGNAVYIKGEKEYIKVGNREIYKFDKKRCTFFPRIYGHESSDIMGYKSWAEIGKNETPDFIHNLKYFFKYQVGFMYFRYFMWNFAGRQNDLQGYGAVNDGNCISGIPFVDSLFLDNQSKLPDSIKNNKSNNKFFLFPLILGLIGFYFHSKKNKKEVFSLLVLFFMTGIAIILYLNQPPYQPRERDYAYAGSFYVFAIWIGLGVLSLVEKIKNNKIVIAVISLCFLLVPVIMAKNGWRAHDRSGKTAVRDYAEDYLNSCEKNAVLFTCGDNDTFPLWYAQEVEGIRTDVRVINLDLLATEWCIEQIRRKVYDSPPVPLSLSDKDYKLMTNEYVSLFEDSVYIELENVLKCVDYKNPTTKYKGGDGNAYSYVPTDKFGFSFNANALNDLPDFYKNKKIENNIKWKVSSGYILKNGLAILDFIYTNKWKRPIYFTSPNTVNDILDLKGYFWQEGFTSRLLPIKGDTIDGNKNVATSVMYNNLMNKFKWGGLDKKNILADDETRQTSYALRKIFSNLANALLEENKKDSAIAVLDLCIKVVPDRNVPYNKYVLPVAEAYCKCGEYDKANKILKRLFDIYEKEMIYYLSLEVQSLISVGVDYKNAKNILIKCRNLASEYKQLNLENDFKNRLLKLKIE
ncbi:MAG: DUF2723 domain-containing protein [Bacteroidales bacterium]|nr:DUF2723 domain-containing protein [Bacteroidales bacterium]